MYKTLQRVYGNLHLTKAFFCAHHHQHPFRHHCLSSPLTEGNVNQALFETIPDSAMCLSETGPGCFFPAARPMCCLRRHTATSSHPSEVLQNHLLARCAGRLQFRCCECQPWALGRPHSTRLSKYSGHQVHSGQQAATK